MDTLLTPAIQLVKLLLTKRDVSIDWMRDHNRRESTKGWTTGPNWLTPLQIENLNSADPPPVRVGEE
jgi:hypothetical protein